MIKVIENKAKSPFFLLMGLVGIIAVSIGFGKTFIIPVAESKFQAPFSVYLHGFFAFSWIILFVLQSLLIHNKKFKVHTRLGPLGVLISLGAAITLIPVGLYTVEKELRTGLGETAFSGLVGTLTSGLMFLLLVVLGIMFRRRFAAHKRFMLLATIVLLWPAWFRFRHYFPHLERPDIWFGVVLADSLIIISWAWDKAKNRKIHPVLLYGGLFIILEHTFELIMFDSEGWRYLAKILYNTLM